MTLFEQIRTLRSARDQLVLQGKSDAAKKIDATLSHLTKALAASLDSNVSPGEEQKLRDAWLSAEIEMRTDRNVIDAVLKVSSITY